MFLYRRLRRKELLAVARPGILTTKPGDPCYIQILAGEDPKEFELPTLHDGMKWTLIHPLFLISRC
jgi:hypothetical protein